MEKPKCEESTYIIIFPQGVSKITLARKRKI